MLLGRLILIRELRKPHHGARRAEVERSRRESPKRHHARNDQLEVGRESSTSPPNVASVIGHIQKDVPEDRARNIHEPRTNDYGVVVLYLSRGIIRSQADRLCLAIAHRCLSLGPIGFTLGLKRSPFHLANVRVLRAEPRRTRA